MLVFDLVLVLGCCYPFFHIGLVKLLMHLGNCDLLMELSSSHYILESLLLYGKY
jgi:hypothetical protein